MVEPMYSFEVDGEGRIRSIIVRRGGTKLVIPSEGIDYSKRNDAIEVLNRAFAMGMRLDGIKVEREAAESLDDFCSTLNDNERKLILLLNNAWKRKSELDEKLRSSAKQSLAGILAGITRNAMKKGNIRDRKESDKLVERRWNSSIRENEYRLGEIGRRVKEILQKAPES
jgi:hypothetical protein